MTINRTTFFAYARRAPFGGRLSTAQVEGMETILDAWDRLRLIDLRWLAYALATAFHEVGGTMQPIREAHGKSDAQTIARLDAEWAKPNHGALRLVREPYWRDGYFARGLSGLTHEANYRKAGDMIGVDLVNNPGRAMEPKISAEILLRGMARGLFRRGKDGRPETFERYFPMNGVADPVGARAIINGGGDKAKLIATHYKAFHDALTAANEMVAQPADVRPEAAKPDDVPASGGNLTAAGGVGLGVTLLGAISNPWALAAFALVLVAGVLWAWKNGYLTVNRKAAA